MARVRQVTGGIVLGVMTLAVAIAAAYALWLGAPLLNPGGDRFTASDIPIINTDAKILVPIPQAQVSPRAGVVQPAPPTAKPKATRVENKAPSKRRSVAKVTRVVARSTKRPTKHKIAVTAHESDEQKHTTRSDDSRESEDSESSKRSDSSKSDSSDNDSSKRHSSSSDSSKRDSSKGDSD